MRFKKQSQALRSFRRTQHLTQRELAHSLGYTSIQFISNIERGQAAIPLPLAQELIDRGMSRRELIQIILTDLKRDLERRLR